MGSKQRLLGLAIAACFVISLGITGLHRESPGHAASGAPTSPTPICGQSILDSPYSYDGAPGTFTTSGTPGGLPTFGSPGTDFPKATRVIVVPAGDNSTAANAGNYQTTDTVVYFEPGRHTLTSGIYFGNNSYYIGGYDSANGKAVLDGDSAHGGTGTFRSKPSSRTQVANTFEYLTIQNFTSTDNDAVLGDINTDYGFGDSVDDGDTYRYNTIGPNEYGWQGKTAYGESAGGGYAINLGSYTTIEYNCLTQNQQGAFNSGNGVDDNISHNEISRNGLGEYPDGPGKGGSPWSCGCSGGGKIFNSVNATVDYNYVHDNYNGGIWFDWMNTGADISYNYISSNWSGGIEYEASYNANITNNTLVGNSWASDGPWPAGVGGGDCSTVTCTQGGGIIAATFGNPQATIYIANSGGNSNLSNISIPSTTAVPGCNSHCAVTSRYSGVINVTGNDLINNFGGVQVYTDTNRFPGDIDHDASCATPFSSLSQLNNPIYYQQENWVITNSDTTISGSTVESTGGTVSLCSDYNSRNVVSEDYDRDAVSAPLVGMGVWDMNTSKYLGKIASVSSAHSFTLSDSPGNESGASLMLSDYGGCGPADYIGGGPGISSGSPPEPYWDNCELGSRNVNVSGNTFSIDANVVKGCTAANECGYQQAEVFNAGVPNLMHFWDSYSNLIGRASGGLNVVWSNNTYNWSGPGGWRFSVGNQGNQTTQAQWTSPPYNQDSGSTFNVTGQGH